MKKSKTEQIFSSSFLFDSVSDMVNEIKEEKNKETRALLQSLRKNYGGKPVVNSDPETQVIVIGKDGRLKGFEEVFWIDSGRYPTKQLIIGIIEDIVEKYGDEIPSFKIEASAHFVAYDSLADKMNGVEGERMDWDWHVNLVDYYSSGVNSIVKKDTILVYNGVTIRVENDLTKKQFHKIKQAIDYTKGLINDNDNDKIHLLVNQLSNDFYRIDGEYFKVGRGGSHIWISNSFSNDRIVIIELKGLVNS
jgi:hypothetical protein